MSVTPALAEKPSFDSVKSILTELMSTYTQQHDIRETLAARGVPLSSISVLLDLLISGPESEFKSLCDGALRVAEENYSEKAVNQSELIDCLQQLAHLEEDAMYVRKMAKGMELNAQAINMLTQIVRQNPGDKGKTVLSALLEYAQACDIPVPGVRVIEGGGEKPNSVLPDIVLPVQSEAGLYRYREIAIELALAVLVTATALTLLT